MRQKAFSSVAAKIQNSGLLSSPHCHWKTAALLAWEGHLTLVENMRIMNISIRDIPWDHMEKLASIVTGRVWIDNMTHTDQLSSILADVKCTWLRLQRMDLSDTETRALVTAIRERAQIVALFSNVTLDVEELTQYDGQGCCSELHVRDDTVTRYGERLRRWAADKGWTVTRDDDVCLRMMKSEII